jgi:single-stranded DNA-binding protein
MRSVNKVILIGNVTWKDDLTRTEGNKAVCTFGMATNRDYLDGTGENMKRQTFTG